MKYPRQLMIELSRICNLHCKECYHENKPGIIDLETFEKIIKNIAAAYKKARQELPILCPWFLSEPLMNMDIHQYLILASNYGYKINLTTNGTIPARLDKLIVPEINYHIIVVSIDGVTGKTYREIRGAQLYDTNLFLKTMENLIQERDLDIPICVKLTKKDIEWAECIDFIKYHFEDKYIKMVSVSNAFDDSDGLNVSRYDCQYLSDFFIIQHDLTIAPCCMRWKAVSAGIGKLDIKKPMDSFYTERRAEIKQSVIDNKPHDYCLGCRSAYTGTTLKGFIEGAELGYKGIDLIKFKKDFYNMFFFNPNFVEYDLRIKD
jgi:sulfatase maturation enzyme AslB (radical SAM superfamily)